VTTYYLRSLQLTSDSDVFGVRAPASGVNMAFWNFINIPNDLFVEIAKHLAIEDVHSLLAVSMFLLVVALVFAYVLLC
jgi:hypothetical protein